MEYSVVAWSLFLSNWTILLLGRCTETIGENDWSNVWIQLLISRRSSDGTILQSTIPCGPEKAYRLAISVQSPEQ